MTTGRINQVSSLREHGLGELPVRPSGEQPLDGAVGGVGSAASLE